MVLETCQPWYSDKNGCVKKWTAEVVEKEPTLFNDVAENAPIDNQQETTQTDQVANNEPETKELLELKEKVLALEIEKQKNDLRAKLIDAGKIEEALKI